MESTAANNENTSAAPATSVEVPVAAAAPAAPDAPAAPVINNEPEEEKKEEESKEVKEVSATEPLSEIFVTLDDGVPSDVIESLCMDC